MRALIEKQPEMFRKIVDAEQPDVIALQEHKLQDAHVEDLTKKLKALLPEYPTVTFACSTVKKGYSGVAVLCKARVVDGGDEVTREPAKKPKTTQPGIAAFFGGAADAPKSAPGETAADARREDSF